METIPVRIGEEFDIERVSAYIRDHMPSPPEDKVHVEQFRAGHSNLTYLLRAGNWKAVLRRPPLGPVAPKAHDMQREAKMLEQIHRVFPLAPKPYLVCSDVSVLGAPFFLMERKEGVVLDQVLPPGYPNTPEMAQVISHAAVDTLVQLHEIDCEKEGLLSLGHPEGYLERQLTGWISRYERAKTDDIKALEEVIPWMRRHLPVSGVPTLVHNDFKLNNMLFSQENPGIVTAVLDWEMSTVGDPLTDLGAAVSYWSEEGDPDGLTSLTASPGFITRNEFIELYAHKSGRDVSQMDFYLTFSFFKIGVICQQIYYRWKLGQTQDPRFEHLGKAVSIYMQKSARVVRESLMK